MFSSVLRTTSPSPAVATRSKKHVIESWFSNNKGMFLNRSLMEKSSLDLAAKSLSSSPGSLTKKSFDTLIKRPNLFVSNAAAPLWGVPKNRSALVLKLILLKLGSFVLMVRAHGARQLQVDDAVCFRHTSFTTRPPMLWQTNTKGLLETCLFISLSHCQCSGVSSCVQEMLPSHS